MKPRVDKELCIKCGLCVSISPESFELDENFKSQVKESFEIEKAEEARQACPVAAIFPG